MIGPSPSTSRAIGTGPVEPQLIPNMRGASREILALYARGLTVREIQAFLRKMYA
jgi:transposase-like protein